MRDPYTVLGVAKSTPPEDVKKAYRRLAKKLHPDQNASDPKAKEKFAELNGAYEILGDADKRAKFDRGEIDAEGKPRHPGFEGFRGGGRGAGPGAGQGGGWRHFEFDMGGAGPGPGGRGGFDASDMFADFFGGRRQRAQRAQQAHGEDIAAIVSVPLQRAAKGGDARVTLPTGRTLDVKIPAGVETGQQIRLRGQGHPAPIAGGKSGDVILTVEIAPHPLFKVDGRDLRLDLPVTIYEAALGGAVQTPTLDGLVEISIPPGSVGKTLRLRGKGLPPAGKKAAGDLFVTPRVALPDAIDPEFEALLRRWRAERPYDPRKGL